MAPRTDSQVDAANAAAKPRTDAQVDAAKSAAQAAASTNVQSYASPFSSYFGGSDTATAYTPAPTDYSAQLNAQKTQTQQLLAQAKKSGDKNAIALANSILDSINQASGLIKSAAGLAGGGVSTGNAGSDYLAAQKLAGQQAAAQLAAEKQAQGQSAFDTLLSEFNQYGLGSLVEPLRSLIQSGATGSTLTLALQNTDAYKQRFAANANRIAAGLTALKPAEYLALEDQYQNLMRQYGLPTSYYTKDSIGTQAGFNQLISNDVSATELEQRLIEAQQKVNQANPEVAQALKKFYPGITNGDILAYSLDPKNALTDIKRKVAAAEIGGSALAQNLATNVGSAEALAAQGVTKQQAQQGYGTIAGYLPTAQQLSDIYNYQGTGPYTQATAEADVFGGSGSAEAQRLRKKLAELETAKFAGQSGTAGTGALSRDRAITNYQLGLSGSGQF